MSFKYVICLDFEATCWEYGHGRCDSEIIEIAAILLNLESGETESQFHCFVRPTLRPKLSRYCINLTGIKQRQIESKHTFPVVLETFIAWLHSLEQKKSLRYTSLAGIRATDDGPNATFCSWSNNDLKTIFRRDCDRNGITCPSILKAWIDVQKRFEILHSNKRRGPWKFSDALQCANIRPVGRAHSGLSDARNLVTMVMYLIRRGLCFSTANDYYH
ncbi:hypothetical protein HA402_013713 [Bradysia odoriphaga]|nr:hypothetical protein HA402_013713 [Bradysia odoriphaga]